MSSRRDGLLATIDNLRQIRGEVMIAYCQLVGVDEFDRRHAEEISVHAEHLQAFCQLMVDYMAMGHFEVYQRIIEGKERRRAVKEATKDVYPSIAGTTNYLVDFNDLYCDRDGTKIDNDKLLSELPKLGDTLFDRSTWEDKILEALESEQKRLGLC